MGQGSEGERCVRGWLTERERMALAVLGAFALAGLGVLAWQQQRPPLVVTGLPAPASSRQAGTSTPVETARWDQVLQEARQVDVNTAGVAELERLPQVGPALARRIVEDRQARGPFRSPQDLARVRGIGPKTVEVLQDYVGSDPNREKE